MYLLPLGGGIPAGVLLARSRGLPWSLTAGLYLLSDLILALSFEPLLRLLVAWGRRVPALAALGWAMRENLRTLATRLGWGSSPLALVLVAYLVDPMTGRTAAMAAGHGPLAGWTIALTGDMLYFATLALATLGLDRICPHPVLTVGLLMTVAVLLPPLAQGALLRNRRPRA